MVHKVFRTILCALAVSAVSVYAQMPVDSSLTAYWPFVLVPPPPAILYQSMEYCWANRTDGASSSAVRSSHFQSPIPNGDTAFAARSVGGGA